jgi:hypothetical protein
MIPEEISQLSGERYVEEIRKYGEIILSAITKRIAVGRDPHSARVLKSNSSSTNDFVLKICNLYENEISWKKKLKGRMLPIWVEDAIDAATIILLFPTAVQLFKNYNETTTKIDWN